MWVLGDAFMRGWYTIHDHTNAQQGFVPIDDGFGVKHDPEISYTLPTEPLPNISSYTSDGEGLQSWVMMLIGIAVLGAMVLLFWLITTYCYRMVFASSYEKAQRKKRVMAVNPNSETHDS